MQREKFYNLQTTVYFRYEIRKRNFFPHDFFRAAKIGRTEFCFSVARSTQLK